VKTDVRGSVGELRRRRRTLTKRIADTAESEMAEKSEAIDPVKSTRVEAAARSEATDKRISSTSCSLTCPPVLTLSLALSTHLQPSRSSPRCLRILGRRRS